MEKYVTPQASYHDVKKISQQLSYAYTDIMVFYATNSYISKL